MSYHDNNRSSNSSISILSCYPLINTTIYITTNIICPNKTMLSGHHIKLYPFRFSQVNQVLYKETGALSERTGFLIVKSTKKHEVEPSRDVCPYHLSMLKKLYKCHRYNHWHWNKLVHKIIINLYSKCFKKISKLHLLSCLTNKILCYWINCHNYIQKILQCSVK